MERKLDNKPDVDEIIKQYQPRIRAFIRSKVFSREDSEDIEHDVFYQLIKTIDNSVVPIQNVLAWLYKVSQNLIINKSKKKKELSLFFDNDKESDNELNEITDIFFPDDEIYSPEMEYIRSLFWLELDNALTDLPLEQREIFELTEFDNIPVKDISALTGLSVNTLLSRKHYAVVFLRNRLKLLYAEIINASG